MSGELLLAIDAGTGSVRAVLFSPDGTQVAVGQREYTHPEVPGVPGSQVFDTTRVWALICDCIRTAVSNAGASASAIRAVSATSMREGMVLYDQGGHEIWACPNVDSRASEEAAELVRLGLAEEIYQHAGDWVSITAPARFRWLARHEPDIFASIAYVGTIGDWILTRLCGEFVTDPSLGSSLGMFELSNRTWSERVIEICELDPEVFPPVIDSGMTLGLVSDQAASETGLSTGTIVVVGGADTQLALLGSGIGDPGQVTIVGGSFWQQTAVVDEPLTDPDARLRTLCHVVPGRWMIEGIGFYSGLVMRWFRDEFCQAEKAQADADGKDVYELLERSAAELPPGAGGVVGVFSNVMNARRWTHGSPSFIGFNVTNPVGSARMACFRAIEESAAYVSRSHLAIVEEITGKRITETLFTGGAACGTLWPQICADTLGVPVHVPVVKESSALGAAICAGVGIGLFNDPLETGQRLVRIERSYQPRVGVTEQYDELYEQSLQIYKQVLELAEHGLVRPLWRAAGA